VTLTPGVSTLGCSWSTAPRIPESDRRRVDAALPLLLWPARVRSYVERRTVVLLAGDWAVWMFSTPRFGRVPPRVAELAEDRLPKLTRSEQAEIASKLMETVSEGKSDDEQIAWLCWLAHGDDLITARHWLEYLEAQCRALLMANRGRVERLAAVLLEVESLSGAAARQVLA
jgi:hypothetical protein